MNIGIDIQPLQYSARDAGIGFYIRNLLYEMWRQQPTKNIKLIVNRRAPRQSGFKLHPVVDWPLLFNDQNPGAGPVRWSVERRNYPAFLKNSNIALFHSNSIAEFDGVTIPVPTQDSKVIVTVYDIIPWIFKDQHPAYWNASLNGYDYAKKLEDICKADAIITVSEHSKSDLVEHLGFPDDKIFVVYGAAGEAYSAVDDEFRIARVRNVYKLPSKYILYVGGYYSHRKNINGLIRAYHIYRALDPRNQLKLVLVGARGSPNGKELLRLVADLGLVSHVHMTHFVRDQDLPVVYSEAEVFFYPSLYEGFGLTPLQAMACGTPVVTSNIASIPEVVGQAAVLIDPNNTEEMAHALYKLSVDEDVREEKIRKGVERAGVFSWAKSACRTLEIYDHMSDK